MIYICVLNIYCVLYICIKVYDLYICIKVYDLYI